MKEYFCVSDLSRYRSFTVFSIRYPAGHSAYLMHGTPSDTMIIMLKGRVRCKMPGQDEILITADTVTCFAKGKERTSVYESDTHLLSVAIQSDSAIFDKPFAQLPVSGMDEHTSACLHTLTEAAAGRIHCSELAAASCLYGLLDFCIGSVSPDISPKYRAVHTAKCSIDSEFTAERPIGDYARAAAMSESTFRRLFTEYTGQPPVRYRLTLRLEYVRLLVRSGECNLSEAVTRAGFSSLPYFCRQFRKIYGQSFSEFSSESQSDQQI